MVYQHYSIAGLILDIIGVVLLFDTGIPPKLDDFFDMYVEMPIKKEMKLKIKARTKRSRIALALIIAGCVLQIIATAMSM